VQAVLGVVGRSLPPSPRAYRGCRISHAGQPRISNFSLDEVFRNEVINHGLDPDYTWINGYLPIIWEKDRYYIEAFLGDIAGKIGLELGCNVGATAIMLSRLGARVTAVDVDKRYVAIAEHNAARYGEPVTDWHLARFILEPGCRIISQEDGTGCSSRGDAASFLGKLRRC